MFLKKVKLFFSFRIFFHKFKFCIIWNWFMPKNYFNLAKMFWGYSKGSKKQTMFLALTEVCHQIFDCSEVQTMWNLEKGCMMYTMKHVLVKRILINGLNMRLLLWVWIKKKVQGVETHWLSDKKKNSEYNSQ